MILRILILFAFLSCTKEHEAFKKNGLYFLKQVESEIHMTKEIEWEVGKKKEVEISKGIRFSTTIPKLTEQAKEALFNKHQIDSWLIKVSRLSRGMSKDLGHFFIRFANMSRTTKDYTINLYYHAAAVSKRFRNFHCPAFNHRFEIEDYSLDRRPNSQATDVYIRPVQKIFAKVSKHGFTPPIMSGGRSLIGNYVVDIALYNSKSKYRFSKWLPTNGIIRVTQEIPRSVASCLGVKEELVPLRESRIPDIRDLEIK